MQLTRADVSQGIGSSFTSGHPPISVAAERVMEQRSTAVVRRPILENWRTGVQGARREGHHTYEPGNLHFNVTREKTGVLPESREGCHRAQNNVKQG